MDALYEAVFIRGQTRLRLAKDGVEVPERVPPVLEDDLSIRPLSEIRGSALCMYVAIAALYERNAKATELCWRWLEKHGLQSRLAECEINLFNCLKNGNKIPAATENDLMGRVEAL